MVAVEWRSVIASAAHGLAARTKADFLSIERSRWMGTIYLSDDLSEITSAAVVIVHEAAPPHRIDKEWIGLVYIER